MLTILNHLGRLCFWIGMLIAIAAIVTAIGALAYPPLSADFWRYDLPIIASCGLWAVGAIAIGWAIRYVLSRPVRRREPPTA
jgi:branched-subunit amino acid ABC-type transport system permease component